MSNDEDQKDTVRNDVAAVSLPLTTNTSMTISAEAPINSAMTCTSASASASADCSDDYTVAQAYQTIETLTTTFLFSYTLAHRAVETCGPDAVACYNWILDNNLAEDKGGPVVPKPDCPHIATRLRVAVEDLTERSVRSPCGHFGSEDDEGTGGGGEGKGGAKGDVNTESGGCPKGENWLCLHSNVVRCSRYVNGHALVHWQNTKKEEEAARQHKRSAAQSSCGDDEEDAVGHCIWVSLGDFSVWCYQCNAYLDHPDFKPYIQKLQELKFGKGEEEEEEVVAVEKHNGASMPQTPKTHDDDNGNKAQKVNVDDTPNGAHGITTTNGINAQRRWFAEEEEDVGGVTKHPHLPKSMKELAEYILSDECESITVLAGAGMSRASGIPDFRSAGGMYETLRPELLTASEHEREGMRIDPTMVYEKDFFLENQLPCLELQRPFIFGVQDRKWKATIAHRFVELLHTKIGKLTRLYTQNIDGLEGQCTLLPKTIVIPVHGRIDRAMCELCRHEMPYDEFCTRVRTQIKDITGEDHDAPEESTPIPCGACGKNTMKPDVVLFRSPLPNVFFESVVHDLPRTDLLMVIGTSLCVGPANSLVYLVPDTALRTVFDVGPVGVGLGIEYGEDAERDYFARGQCEEKVAELMDYLGWIGDLEGVLDELPVESREIVEQFRTPEVVAQGVTAAAAGGIATAGVAKA